MIAVVGGRVEDARRAVGRCHISRPEVPIGYELVVVAAAAAAIVVVVFISVPRGGRNKWPDRRSTARPRPLPCFQTRGPRVAPRAGWSRARPRRDSPADPWRLARDPTAAKGASPRLFGPGEGQGGVKRSTGHTHTHRQRTTPPTPTHTRTRREQHPKRTPRTSTSQRSKVARRGTGRSKIDRDRYRYFVMDPQFSRGVCESEGKDRFFK